MRLESSVTSVSWIPSEAVTGAVLKGTFEAGFTHYDDPPPDEIDDLEEMRAAGALPLRQPPRGVGRHRGRARSSTPATRAAASWARRRSASPTSARRSSRCRSPTSATTPRSRTRSRGSCRPPAGEPGLPAPRRVKHPPFIQFKAPTVWTTLGAHDPRRRHVGVRGARREQVPPALDLRRRRTARGEGRARRLQGLVPRRVRQVHAVGRARLEGARHRGRDRARTRALHHDHAQGRQGRDPHDQEGQAARASRATSGNDLFLLLDGVLAVLIDGEPVAEVGPGAILGERAVLEGGIRTSTLEAQTACRVAVARPDQIDRAALLALAEKHRRETK